MSVRSPTSRELAIITMVQTHPYPHEDVSKVHPLCLCFFTFTNPSILLLSTDISFPCFPSHVHVSDLLITCSVAPMLGAFYALTYMDVSHIKRARFTIFRDLSSAMFRTHPSIATLHIQHRSALHPTLAVDDDRLTDRSAGHSPSIPAHTRTWRLADHPSISPSDRNTGNPICDSAVETSSAPHTYCLPAVQYNR